MKAGGPAMCTQCHLFLWSRTNVKIVKGQYPSRNNGTRDVDSRLTANRRCQVSSRTQSFQSGQESLAMELPSVMASADALREAVIMACQTSGGRKMLRGRAEVLSASKAWVLAHIERVAEDAIDWGDYWDYRRL